MGQPQLHLVQIRGRQSRTGRDLPVGRRGRAISQEIVHITTDPPEYFGRLFIIHHLHFTHTIGGGQYLLLDIDRQSFIRNGQSVVIRTGLFEQFFDAFGQELLQGGGYLPLLTGGNRSNGIGGILKWLKR